MGNLQGQAAAAVDDIEQRGSDPQAGDIELLHRISVALIGEQDLQELYGRIVDAAVAIAGSQFATLQRLCPPGDPSGHGGELQLLAHHGLPPEALAYWQSVRPTAHSSCALALRQGRRAVIPDFEQWREIAGTDDLAAFRRSGIRSAQTTPLLSRTGALLGMISTHWKRPHQPSARDLRLLDILARQAADLLDRTIADEALRRLNETLEQRIEERSRELVASEDQVRQMQKMEAIGQLTGGVAHDFNNLLTIIRSSAELLGRRELPRDKQQKYIHAISETADRAARLTGQLLAFARRQSLKPEVFDAVGRVEAIADMLRTVVGARIALVIEPGVEHCFVRVDASQFETAMVNLAVNARDAMDGEGHLVIGIEAVDAVPPVRGHAGAAGTFACVRMTDEGTGIAAEQLPRIFEPFFTTKAVGKGTGLGLSQVYGFAKQSGGEIDVASRVGRGTTFRLYLPCADAANDAEAVVQPTGDAEVAARILVVEDNAKVGEFATQLLDDLGHATRYVGNARDALAMLERDHAAFDVVFSDVVMPGIDGLTLGRAVRARWPDLAVVLTSGYSDVLADDAEHGFPLLRKPYSVDELSKVLRDARQRDASQAGAQDPRGTSTGS